ncbi:TlpA family protein disulfide reductase [Lutimonas sp.]|jgi:thiol-disulfide isomerase/thioredoxin|uniref:TlpA family protein disulfide reductase n=1 Tax=Lutimonas sp. TaxID=1872403 RepID=UPI003C7290F7
MKGIMGLLILMLCISISCKEVRNEESKDSEKEVLFTDMKGLPVSLEQFKGKRILVNYWATWCVPCLKEFPSLVEAEELLSDENYVFLFPSPDNPREILDFNKSSNYPLRFLSLNQSLDKLNIYALPSTVIYATDGSVYKKIDGATVWSSPELIEMLRSVP